MFHIFLLYPLYCSAPVLLMLESLHDMAGDVGGKKFSAEMCKTFCPISRRTCPWAAVSEADSGRIWKGDSVGIKRKCLHGSWHREEMIHQMRRLNQSCARWPWDAMSQTYTQKWWYDCRWWQMNIHNIPKPLEKISSLWYETCLKNMVTLNYFMYLLRWDVLGMYPIPPKGSSLVISIDHIFSAALLSGHPFLPRGWRSSPGPGHWPRHVGYLTLVPMRIVSELLRGACGKMIQDRSPWYRAVSMDCFPNGCEMADPLWLWNAWNA